METIHQKIKSARLKKGLSMEQLAKEVGVSSWQTVQQWEKENGTAPQRKRMQRVAEVLGLSMSELMANVLQVAESRPPITKSAAMEMTIDELMNALVEKIVNGHPADAESAPVLLKSKIAKAIDPGARIEKGKADYADKLTGTNHGKK